MWYFPGLITLVYAYLAVKKTDYQDNAEPAYTLLQNVACNLLITELVFLLGWMFDLLVCHDCGFSLLRLIMFYILQDIYFYSVHRFLFHGPLWNWHSYHHAYITSVAAWYGHPIEHLVLNLGSIIVPYWVFSNPSWVLFVIILQQIYTSVNGHTKTSPHSIHHLRNNMRFGSIYLIDRLMGSF